ncbi:DUF362 domain-containing protein [bacterium]|nr:DUF362 domain-containing protein [bacterium]
MGIDRSRRDFLKVSIGSAGCLAAGGIFQSTKLIAQDSASTSKDISGSSLSVVQGETGKALVKALEMYGGMRAFVRAGQTVLLKPNMSFPNPKTWGSDTSPDLVKAVALEALGAGAARVIVADNTMRRDMESFNRSGLTEALAGIDKVKILPIQEESLFTEIPVPNGSALKSVKIAKLIQKADVLINLPCAKSHSATDVSFGLKNLMGLIWDRGYLHTGTDLHTAIAELATVIRPQLTILDASRALLMGGPTGPGKVQDLNILVVGTDPLAVDAYATTLGNWNNRSIRPAMVRHLAAASRIGVGEIDLEKIRIVKATV